MGHIPNATTADICHCKAPVDYEVWPLEVPSSNPPEMCCSKCLPGTILCAGGAAAVYRILTKLRVPPKETQ